MRSALLFLVLGCLATHSLAFTPNSITSNRRSYSSATTRLFGSPEPLGTEGEWTAYLDEDTTGVVYYFNSRTGESLWEPPTDTFPDVYLKPSARRKAEAKREAYYKSVEPSEEKKGFLSSLLDADKKEQEILEQEEEPEWMKSILEEKYPEEKEKPSFFSRLLSAPAPEATTGAPAPAPAPAVEEPKEDATPKKGFLDNIFETISADAGPSMPEPFFAEATENEVEKAARIAKEDQIAAEKKAADAAAAAAARAKEEQIAAEKKAAAARTKKEQIAAEKKAAAARADAERKQKEAEKKNAQAAALRAKEEQARKKKQEEDRKKAQEEAKMAEMVRKAEAEQKAEADRLAREAAQQARVEAAAARKAEQEAKREAAAAKKAELAARKAEQVAARKAEQEARLAEEAARKAEDQLVVEEVQTPIKVDVGSCVLPHPSKMMWGGEDAVFTKGRTFGVFDGVSGADKMEGLPLYSKMLARQMTQLVGNGIGLAVKDMQDNLLTAAEIADERATGASTAVVASITEDGFLRAINLGDSACIVIRGGKVVAKTKEIVHYFDCPYQLSDISPDRPRDARKMNYELLRGDTVLLASDGVFDNLEDSEIAEIATSGGKSSAIAKQVSDRSRKVSLNSNAPTPYSKQAKRNGDPDFRDGLGGKVDDISCVVVQYD